MSLVSNQHEVELLHSDPNKLILSYQDIIDIILSQFIRSNSFRAVDREEIKQQIYEELLKRLPKISCQYEGKSLLRTYFTVIIRNICNEILRKKEKNHFVNIDEIKLNYSHNDTLTSLLIAEETNKLKKAIELNCKKQQKLLLCLNLRFRMQIDFMVFKNTYESISLADFNSFMQHISPYNESSDILIFSALTQIDNQYNQKNNTPDALRKWTDLKIKELINILNGEPPASKYNEETFQILFEKAYSKETFQAKNAY
jgi:DNA-directed RNA polymerase specialized sigma24 family protein